MTQLLRTYYEMSMNPESSIVKSLAATIPKNIGYNHDGKLMRVKELLLSENVESTTLIQAEVHKTVMEGAEPSICLRNALQTIPMKTKVMNWTVGETGSYAPEVAEGADIPLYNQDYASVEFKAKKYGGRPAITNELLEDSPFALAEIEMQKAGRRIENTMNQNGVTEMIDTFATNEHDTAGNNQGIKAIAKAVSNVRAQGFIPDTLIMHPEAEAAVLAEFVPTNYFPTESIVRTGMVPNLLGLRAFTCGVTSNGTKTWGYGADEIGMVVYDSMAAAAIGMRRDITVEEYSDPIKDMTSMTVTGRHDVEVMLEKAGSRIVG